MPIVTSPVRQTHNAIPALERNVPGQTRNTFAGWGPRL